MEELNDWFDTSFASQRMMAILRGFDAARTVELAGRAWDLGLDCVEVPIQTPEAVASLRATVQAGRERDRHVGAGTVTTLDQVSVAQAAGAAFTVPRTRRGSGPSQYRLRTPASARGSHGIRSPAGGTPGAAVAQGVPCLRPRTRLVLRDGRAVSPGTPRSHRRHHRCQRRGLPLSRRPGRCRWFRARRRGPTGITCRFAQNTVTGPLRMAVARLRRVVQTPRSGLGCLALLDQ